MWPKFLNSFETEGGQILILVFFTFFGLGIWIKTGDKEFVMAWSSTLLLAMKMHRDPPNPPSTPQ